ncbi:hypothetical protein Rhow_001615 [Rhodococcus wratislaviensis]|uniref:Uncharacterized protein n=1 Tax=Rhodococcus wratislaviensis TaxID=44752 RepID=A0A402BYF0_RHOWR|nr:hypothetical protein Rhow_001615 [Rhodococcus wratislaviensis]
MHDRFPLRWVEALEERVGPRARRRGGGRSRLGAQGRSGAGDSVHLPSPDVLPELSAGILGRHGCGCMSVPLARVRAWGRSCVTPTVCVLAQRRSTR